MTSLSISPFDTALVLATAVSTILIGEGKLNLLAGFNF